ncbi:MAG TPA: hypothetical protein DCE07_04810, partial [Peptococcaceae bacterium]|nr:hypothetical protein [Peptococcaceae bacterium]
QRWRAGQEGTISELKRRYGVGRTLYREHAGCRRWVGGVIWGYNLKVAFPSLLPQMPNSTKPLSLYAAPDVGVPRAG